MRKSFYHGPTYAERRNWDRVSHNLAMDRAGGLGDARRVARDKDRVRRRLKMCAVFEGTSAAC
jgi:hypothetical protein